MITHNDPVYVATKRIKQGRDRLEEPFAGLARWISATWGVTVLSIDHKSPDTVWPGTEHLTRPRLRIILEFEKDLDAFLRGASNDHDKESLIKQKFIELCRSEHVFFDPHQMYCYFTAFAPVAREEADAKISDT